MKSLKWVLLFSLLATYANAQEKVYLDVSKLVDGDYHLKIEGGKITLHPIIVLKPNITPTDPDPDPDPTEITKLKNKVRASTSRVNDPMKADTKRKLSGIYRSIAVLPLGTKENFQTAINALFQAAMTQLERMEQWKDWKIETDESLEDIDDDRFKDGLEAVADVLGEES